MAIGGKRQGAGRPAGVPNKVNADVRALAQEYGKDAVAELARIMLKSENDSARIAAAKELLDRGYGKAIQGVQLTGEDGGPVQFQRIERVLVDPKAPKPE